LSSLKILHLTQNYAPLGGVERYVLSLLPELERRGHRNVIIHRTQNRAAPNSNGRVSHFVPYSPDPQADRRRILEHIIVENPSVIYLHDVYDPHVIKIAAETGSSVAFVHGFNAVCPGLAKTFRINEAVCERAFGTGCIAQIYLRRCSEAKNPLSVRRIMGRTRDTLGAYSSVSRILVASSYMRSLLVQNGLAAKSIRVLPLFVDLPRESRDRQRSKREQSPQILFVGRLEFEKGLPYLLQALVNIDVDYRLIVCGDGTLRRQYQEMSKNLGISNRVSFVGWLDPKELGERYLTSSVTVMPTVMPEPFGLVGVESMAHGCPVIAFDVGGISDWLHHGRNGFLVPARNDRELAHRIVQVLSDSELQSKLGAYARRTAEKHYSPEVHVEELLKELAIASENGDRALRPTSWSKSRSEIPEPIAARRH